MMIVRGREEGSEARYLCYMVPGNAGTGITVDAGVCEKSSAWGSGDSCQSCELGHVAIAKKRGKRVDDSPGHVEPSEQSWKQIACRREQRIGSGPPLLSSHCIHRRIRRLDQGGWTSRTLR